MTRYPPLGQLGPRAISEWGLRTQAAAVRLEGGGNIPARGPVLLAARHFHHLLDGAVLVTRTVRPIHIVVGLDWAATARQRRLMEWMCRAAEYPIVLRPPTLERTGSYRRDELLRYTRAALRETTRLLRAGRVVLVFPEGYPNVDPTGTRKRTADDWLPFEGGFLKMLELAERDGVTQVALVPVGFAYEPVGFADGPPGSANRPPGWVDGPPSSANRPPGSANRPPGSAEARRHRWSITARIGPPLAREHRSIGAIEAAVRRLSAARL